MTVGLDGDFLPEGEVRGGVLGFLPVGLAFSGQSMPLRRMRSALLLCRTLMVSPSRTETTVPEKSAKVE